MVSLYSLDCCGIKEINNLAYAGGPKTALKSFFKYGQLELRYLPAHIIFTQVCEKGRRSSDDAGDYGDKFAAYVRSQGLGTVRSTKSMVNGNTGSTIKLFTWTLSHDGVRKWKRRNRVTKVERYSYWT